MSSPVLSPPDQRRLRVRRAMWWGIPIVVVIVLSGWALTTIHRPQPAAQSGFLVSQRGRAFNPGALTVRRGDNVRIVNDDGDLTHHAYVASDRFSFDSGDQAPGRDVNITFGVPGTFNVLCGIHPKMRLTVTVQP